MRAGKVIAIAAGGVVALAWVVHLTTSTTLALGSAAPSATVTATGSPSVLSDVEETTPTPTAEPTDGPTATSTPTSTPTPPPDPVPAGLAQQTWTSTHAARTGTFTVVVKSVVQSQEGLTVVFGFVWNAPRSQSAVLGDFLVPSGSDPYLYVWPAFMSLPNGAMAFPLCSDGNFIVNGHVRTPSETTCYQIGMFGPKDPWNLTITGGQWIEYTLLYGKMSEGSTTINLVLPGGMPAFPALPITFR